MPNESTLYAEFPLYAQFLNIPEVQTALNAIKPGDKPGAPESVVASMHSRGPLQQRFPPSRDCLGLAYIRTTAVSLSPLQSSGASAHGTLNTRERACSRP